MLFNTLNKKWQRRDIQTGLLLAATIAVSSMVELMILSFGGHQSIYFGGIILIFMYTLGFIPLLSLAKTIMFAVVTFGIYLGPIILFDTITNPNIFLNNTIFVAATGITGILWRHSNDKLLLKKISLEYDLSKDKEQLEIYSNQLEDLVQERTKELSISEKWHRSIFDNATDGIIVLNRNGVIVNVNRKACDIHDFDRNALVGINVELLEA
jgi:PAS domain-containing protein